MSVNIRQDSLYKYADPYYDEQQKVYVWGIADPPPAIKRADDIFYEVKQEDRLDLIAYRLLGDPNYWWIIAHYNLMKDAFDLERFRGKSIRLPSRLTVQRYFISEPKRSYIS